MSNPLSIVVDEDWSAIRRSVRAICARFPAAYWREKDEQAAYPSEFVEAMTSAGYLAALIPDELGGSGLPLRAAAVILETVHASGANAGACHAQMYIMGALLRHGSAAQKAEWLPGIADGSLRLQAFGVSEPDAGTDTTRIRTMAVRHGDSYIINGQKIWTSRAAQSDLMLLLARTTPLDQAAKRTLGMSLFLVDMRVARGRGLAVRPIATMINHNTTEVFIEDLRVPAGQLIGEEGRGFYHILDGMNAERILLAAEAVGDGRWFIERATTYAQQRKVFGRPIGQNQGIQFPLARAFAEIEAADLMVRKAAGLFDAGRACGAEANTAKLLASEASWRAAEACMQTFGGYGFAKEYDVERKWRETRLFQTAPISTNLVLAHLAQHVLGLPRT